MKNFHTLLTKMILMVVTTCLLLTSCATPKPILYPNAHMNKVGQEQTDRDIAECKAMADQYVSSSSHTASNIAKSTAMGAGTGAAGGAVGGAIRGSAGSGSMIGAAAGATMGLIRGIFRGTEPNRTYQRFIDSCLRDRGYESAGWD